jgi:hypothetical protein
MISAFKSNYGYSKMRILTCQLHLRLMYKNCRLIVNS